MTDTLIQRIYTIRKGQRIPHGVFVGKKLDNQTVGIGYSMCKRGDIFDYQFGKQIATDRAVKGFKNLPDSLSRDMSYFEARCKRYFKGAEICGQI